MQKYRDNNDVEQLNELVVEGVVRVGVDEVRKILVQIGEVQLTQYASQLGLKNSTRQICMIRSDDSRSIEKKVASEGSQSV